MADYLTPADVGVSDTWQGHRDRNPPSGEPGTDYATSYGTPVRIAGDGVVSVVDTSPSGAEGRRLSIDLDDGRRVSYIHLSGISAYVGQRVGRGQTGTAWTGASGNGEDHFYGPHVHVSLWERPGMAYADTIDFQRYVGEDDDDMNAEQDNRLRNIENYLAIPGAGYGRPEVIQQRVDAIHGKLETGAGYDWLPAINNNVWALWTPVALSVVLSLISAVGSVMVYRRR